MYGYNEVKRPLGMGSSKLEEWMKGEKNEEQDTTQEQSKDKMTDNRENGEAVIEDDKEELAKATKKEVSIQADKDEKFLEEEKKEKITEDEKACDIDEAETHLDSLNYILIDAEIKNKALRRKVKLYRNAIADSNEFSKTTEALHKELNDLSEKYYDLETRMIEHFGLEFNVIRHLLESAP